MKKNIHIILPVISACLLIFAAFALASLRAENNQLVEEITELHSEMIDKKATNEILVDSIKMRDQEIVELERKLEEEKWIY